MNINVQNVISDIIILKIASFNIDISDNTTVANCIHHSSKTSSHVMDFIVKFVMVNL